MRALKSWAVQNTGFRINERAEIRIMDALRSTKTKMHSFGVIPFTNEITGWETLPDEEMFVHCSTKVLKILNNFMIPSEELFPGAGTIGAHQIRRNLTAGLFYHEEAFDQSYYMKLSGVKDILLNGDGYSERISSILDTVFDTDVFVKPSKDLKAFKGGVIYQGRTLREQVYSGTMDASFEDAVKNQEKAIIAPLKHLQREWRFFVVDGEVITGSLYMVNSRVQYSDEIPNWVVSYAQHYADKYNPSRAFTMDLGVTTDLELKVVEYNCLNCSGLYHSDIEKLIRALAVLR